MVKFEAPAGPPSGRVTCPECRCRLDVFEAPSGGRTVYVVALSLNVEAKALEGFVPPVFGICLAPRAAARSIRQHLIVGFRALAGPAAKRGVARR
jgi:hypothetical protein